MKRTYGIILFILFVLSVSQYADVFADTGSSGSLPNILFIILDTTRADHLGCYGYRRSTSPHIDQLARESVLFSDAVTVIPLTTPSHATIMTGLYPEHHQVYRNSFPVHSQFSMMAEMLKKEGYHTAGFVSVKLIGSRVGFAQGFDYFSDIPLPRELATSDDEGKKSRRKRMLTEERLQRKGDITVDLALDWLRMNNHEPYFLWVHLYDPHLSYTPPDEYGFRFNPNYDKYLNAVRNPWLKRKALADLNSDYDMSDPSTYGRPKTVLGLFAALSGLGRKEFVLPMNIPPKLAEDLISAYDGEISFSDDQIARIFRVLKTKGIYEDTIIIFMADHGEILYEKENYFGHHEYLYEGSMVIPVIMKFPGVQPQTINKKITNVDILPTLLDAVAIDSKAAMDGVSYWPLIARGNVVEGPEHLLYVTHSGQPRLPVKWRDADPIVLKIRRKIIRLLQAIPRFFNKLLNRPPKWKILEHFDKIAVLQGEWKLIRSVVVQDKKEIRYELFNVKNDPAELHELSNEEKDTYKELKKIIDAFIKEKRYYVVPPSIRSEEERKEEVETLRSLGYM